MDPAMGALRNFLLLLSRLVLLPAWYLSGFMPRRRDLWVFGSWGGHRYADNAAALFELCQKRLGHRVTLVWISRDRNIVAALRGRGFAAHRASSPLGLWYCLRAGLHLFDCFAKDTNFWPARGAVKINLWSGIPLKAFERDIDNPRSRYYRLFHGSAPERALLAMMMPWHVERPHLIIATAPETAAITARAFGVSRRRVAITGFPRNDGLTAGSQTVPQDLPAPLVQAWAARRRIFLYMPSFRDSGRDYACIDWGELDALMAATHATFVCKRHPMDQGAFPGEYAHILEFPRERDVYDMLPLAAALISDYSSIVFDYLLLDRPIILYTPDLDEFVATERRLNFRPEEVAAGPVCRTWAELARALRAVVTGAADSAAPARTAVTDRFHTWQDGRSGERVLGEIASRFAPGLLPELEPGPGRGVRQALAVSPRWAGPTLRLRRSCGPARPAAGGPQVPSGTSPSSPSRYTHP